MHIPALFHWSPIERRDQILREGLQIYSEPVVHSGEEMRFPYLCFGTTPSNAWGLSGDMEWTGNYEVWDLWQYWVGEKDNVHILPTFGPVVEEVRIFSSIPPNDLWYVATRERHPEVKVVKKQPPKQKRKARKKK